MVCTFFGHRFVQDEIEPALMSTLTDLIEKHGVTLFYVGNHGGFDSMVCRALKKLAKSYSIDYRIVLAYMPAKKSYSDATDYSKSILPNGIETVPKRFAISFRNKWMILQSDYVVTYVTHSLGSSAAQFKAMAQKKGKTVIELSRETD